LRAIEPVTSFCCFGAITVDGSKNEAMLPIWPVASGSAPPGTISEPCGDGIGRPGTGVVFGASLPGASEPPELMPQLSTFGNGGTSGKR
jgi:hypothetical protein